MQDNIYYSIEEDTIGICPRCGKEYNREECNNDWYEDENFYREYSCKCGAEITEVYRVEYSYTEARI